MQKKTVNLGLILTFHKVLMMVATPRLALPLISKPQMTMTTMMRRMRTMMTMTTRTPTTLAAAAAVVAIVLIRVLKAWHCRLL